MVSLIVSSLLIPSLKFRSRNSLTVFELLPIAFAFLTPINPNPSKSHPKQSSLPQASGERDIPRRINPTRFSHVQPRNLISRIKPHNQSRNPKRSNSSTLRIPLLHPSNILCNILHGNRILHRKSMTLRLYSSPINQDSRIGIEACKGTTDVGVEEGDFADCAGILEF